MNTIFQSPEYNDVKNLLSESDLPYADLTAIQMRHFFGCSVQGVLKGIVGLEQYGQIGLLRSLAVSSDVRGQGCGADLVDSLERYATTIGVNQLYLLTTTAECYFSNRGYNKIDRTAVPNEIKETREFSELCPGNAVVMKKEISS